MRAAVIEGKGVIHVRDVPMPSPTDGEVLLKVEMAALCGTDQRVLRGEKDVDVPIVGHEITGRVVEVGKGVKGVQIGERYALQTVIGCGECEWCRIDRQNLCTKGFRALGYAWNGGFAEYMIMPREGVEQGCLIPIPDSFSDELGTMVEPLSCCINGMRYLPLEEMQSVVIMGAGIIGVMNGLVAKARGAREVIMMDVAANRLDMLSKMGLPLEAYVNSAEVTPVDWVRRHTNGRGVDGVVVAASVKQLVGTGLQMLARGGHLSIFAGMSKQDPMLPLDLNLIHYLELNVHGANSSVRRDYIEAINLMQRDPALWERLVTHRFPLNQFNQAFQTQGDPAVNSLKVMIKP
jgi:L-iditol 2-dehydrogenase